MNVKNKIRAAKIAVMSLVIAWCLFIVAIAIQSKSLIKLEESTFREFSQRLDEDQFSVYLLAKLIESKMDSIEQGYEDGTKVSAYHNQYFYSLEHPNGSAIVDLTHVDNQVSSLALKAVQLSFDEINRSSIKFMSKKDWLFYRDYGALAMLTPHKKEKFVLTKPWFSFEDGGRCQVHLTCTIYNSEYALSDRISISPIYKDESTKKRVLTIASPVYHKGKIIGDVNVDVELSSFSFFAEKNIKRHSEGGNIVTFITDFDNALSLFSYDAEYIADNRNVFIYRISFFYLLLNNWQVFALLFVVVFFISTKLMHLTSQRKTIESISEQVNKDSQTGLYNKSLLKSDDFLAELSQSSASVISIDGDGLKAINDNYGHHVGDLAIEFIAEKMKGTFRSSDYLIRTGGDEFLAILPECELDIAQNLIAQLTDALDNNCFYSDLKVHASMGVALLELGGLLEETIIRSDKALYTHKKSKKMQGRGNGRLEAVLS